MAQLLLLLLLAVAAVRVHAACDEYSYTDDATPECTLCHVDEDACTAVCHPFSNDTLASWPMRDADTATSGVIRDARGRYPLTMYGNVSRTSTGPGIVCGSSPGGPFGLASDEQPFADLKDDITSNQHYSLETWVLRRFSLYSPSHRRLFRWGHGLSPSHTNLALMYNSNDAAIAACYWTGDEGIRTVFDNAPWSEDELLHIVLSVTMPETDSSDNIHVALYKNGVLQEEVNEPTTGDWEPWSSPDSYISICSAYPYVSENRNLHGRIYSTTLYGRLMTQKDVTLLYQAGKDALWACGDLTLNKLVDDDPDYRLIALIGIGVVVLGTGVAAVVLRHGKSSTSMAQQDVVKPTHDGADVSAAVTTPPSSPQGGGDDGDDADRRAAAGVRTRPKRSRTAPGRTKRGGKGYTTAPVSEFGSDKRTTMTTMYSVTSEMAPYLPES